MRSIITQFSLLVGIITMLNLNAETANTLGSVSWGIAAGCLVYLVLLLGDFSVQRYLDAPANGLTSVRFREGSDESEMFDDSLTGDLPSESAISTISEKEHLAA